MRAPKNEATGTSGQSFVKAEFEELGWGAVPNPEHDLGTDLWLMARDENRFDLGALVGVQVKTGDSYFESVATLENSQEIVGWWYSETDDNHFDYWSQHVTPHILVLRNTKSKTSYWVHVTAETIQSTGKGNKILVPSTQTIDENNRDSLTAVATSASKNVSLDGSAWGTTWKVSSSDRLRYALIAPRLIAPHPNKGNSYFDATEALAMLVQGRFSELWDVSSAEKRAKTNNISDTESWIWKLFDAIWAWTLSGDLEMLCSVPDTDDVYFTVAGAIAKAAALIEQGRVEDALAAVRSVPPVDELDTVSIAWLKSQEARCLAETGRVEEARNLALEVQRIRVIAPNDPTARALVAVSTKVVFDTSGFGLGDIGELIQSMDTSTRWWRSQTIASGLESHFDEHFKKWACDSSVTIFATDPVWSRLRSATLLAGFSADHSGWRSVMSLLARREIMTSAATDTEIFLESLKDMLWSGATKDLALTVRKLSDDGPVEPLVRVLSALDLESMSRSCLAAALELVRYAGEFAEMADADRHMAWLISALKNIDALQHRLKLNFLFEPALIQSICGLLPSTSLMMKRKVMDLIISLPVIDNQVIARCYGRLFSLIGEDQWTPSDLKAMSERSDDNWELQDDIDGILAVKRPEFRSSLLSKIEQGDFIALSQFGKVSDLPEDAAKGAMSSLRDSIGRQVKLAQSGEYGLGGYDFGSALVILNAWHPTIAQWEGIEVLLAEPKVHSSHIMGTLEALGNLANQISAEEKLQLKPILESIMQRTEDDSALELGPKNATTQAASRLALLRLFPDNVSDSLLQTLLIGSSGEREIVAKIAGTRGASGDFNLLVSLARDSDRQVRITAITNLVRLLADGSAPSAMNGVICELVVHSGPKSARQLSGYLLDKPASEGRNVVLQSLADHESSIVRALIATAMARREHFG